MITERIRITMKSRLRQIIAGTVSAVALISLLVLGIFTAGNEALLTPAVHAQEANGVKCSNSTIAGRYAIKGDGFVPGGPPPAPLVPFAVVSLMTLDSSGTLSNDVTVSRNTVITRNVDPGTFTINEDCTGDMTINIVEPPFQLKFDLVVADKGNEFYAIATTPSVVTFGAKRVH
jgi:hypothetical protein